MHDIKPISKHLVTNGRIIAYVDRPNGQIILDDLTYLTEVHLLYPEFKIISRRPDATPDYKKDTQ